MKFVRDLIHTGVANDVSPQPSSWGEGDEAVASVVFWFSRTSSGGDGQFFPRSLWVLRFKFNVFLHVPVINRFPDCADFPGSQSVRGFSGS